MRLAFRFQLSGFRSLHRFPLAERAALGGHAELRPGGAATLAAAARGVECLRVPFGAGAAGGFACGQGFGRGGGEARPGEAACGLHGAEHFFASAI